MSSFKLTYFDATGRGELTRLIFAKSGTKFEDVRIAAADWPKVKGKQDMAVCIAAADWPKVKRKQ